MTDRTRIYSEVFARAREKWPNSRMFIAEICEGLGPNMGRDVIRWAGAQTTEQLQENLSTILNEGVTDEFQLRYYILDNKIPEICNLMDDKEPGSNSEIRSTPDTQVSVSDTEKSAPRTPALIGQELKELTTLISDQVYGYNLSSTPSLIIIEGPRQYGRTIALREIKSNIEGRGLKVGDNILEKHIDGTVIVIDDIDSTFRSNYDMEQKVSQRIREGGLQVVATLSTTKFLQKSILFEANEIHYTMPRYTPEEVSEILKQREYNNYKLSCTTCDRISAILNYRHVNNPVYDGLRISALLLMKAMHMVKDRNECVTNEPCILEFNESEILTASNKITNAPILDTTNDLSVQIKNQIGRYIKGQEHIIDSILPNLESSYRGITDPDRPAGVFFFYGPHGVGKSEMAKVIADSLFNGRCHIEQMNTYKDKYHAARFSGAPPGYVGYDDTPPIWDFVDRYNNGVILLDEIEKAHEDIIESLMEMFDTGVFRDSSGKTHDARGFIFIMSSNITVSSGKQSNSIGFQGVGDKSEVCTDEQTILRDEIIASKAFKPEVVNRFQRVGKFKELDSSTVSEVAELMITNVVNRLAGLNVVPKEPEVLQRALTYLPEVTAAYTKKGGARAIRTYIETTFTLQFIKSEESIRE